MEHANTTLPSNWTAVHTQMFSSFKNMFNTNPTNGEVIRKNDKESWQELMANLAKQSRKTCIEPYAHCSFNKSNAKSGLSSIVVWPGGKTKELKHIYANLPSYDRFFEPFVGGGSVFMGINAREYYINDLSSNLISLYKNISSSDELFLHYLEAIDRSIVKAKEFSMKHQNELADIYEQYRCDALNKEDMKVAVNKWCITNHKEILEIISEFVSFPCSLVEGLKKYLSGGQGKFIRLKGKNITNPNWIYKHLEAAIQGAVYNNFRKLFNNKVVERSDTALHSALMVYIRQFVTGGRFQYDKAGNFNASFGGIRLLDNRLNKKLEYFRSTDLREHFRNTYIFNSDFEKFLLDTAPAENDFIFLDPPYDCAFTEYDSNEFTQIDHKRLANYLLTNCKAKWMMIINKTDFISHLYNHPGIFIQEYQHSYTCNTKYNTDRTATHLLITNYTPMKDGEVDMFTTTRTDIEVGDEKELPILAA